MWFTACCCCALGVLCSGLPNIKCLCPCPIPLAPFEIMSSSDDGEPEIDWDSLKDQLSVGTFESLQHHLQVCKSSQSTEAVDSSMTRSQISINLSSRHCDVHSRHALRRHVFPVFDVTHHIRTLCRVVDRRRKQAEKLATETLLLSCRSMTRTGRVR